MTITPTVQALQVRPGETLYDVLPFTDLLGTTTTRDDLDGLIEHCKTELANVANNNDPEEWEWELVHVPTDREYGSLFYGPYKSHDGKEVGFDIVMSISNDYYEQGSIQVVVELP